MARNAWELFAKSGAEHYICTEIDSSTPEGLEAFFRSGQEYVDGIVTDLAGRLPQKHAALDFGCGIGRLAIPLAGHFERVTAVDISPTMLDRLRANCEARRVTNVTPCLSGDVWEATGPFDLVNSFLVFQHLPDDREVATYLGRLAGCLADAGICQLQFDSRPKTLAYRTRNALPDAVLPERWRSGLRRIRRTPAELRALLDAAGLQIVDQHRAGSELHIIRAVKA